MSVVNMMMTRVAKVGIIVVELVMMIMTTIIKSPPPEIRRKTKLVR